MGNFLKIRKSRAKKYHSSTNEDNIMKLYVDSISNKFLTKEEQLYYGKLFREGNSQEKITALNRLVESSLFLVLRITKDNYYVGIDIQDLVQEGNVGLIKAVEKYDYRKGYAFTTYACWWIRQAISKAIKDKASGMRIPVHVYEFERKINAARQELMAEGIEPTEELIAKRLDKDIQYLQKHAVNFGMRHVVSLDVASSDQGDNWLSFFLNLEDPRSNVVDNLSKREIKKLISLLMRMVIRNEKEKHVLCLRYGLCTEIDIDFLIKYKELFTQEKIDRHGQNIDKDIFDFFRRSFTRDEVSKLVGLTRERVRQLEYKALKKLKEFSNEHREMFVDFY